MITSIATLILCAVALTSSVFAQAPGAPVPPAPSGAPAPPDAPNVFLYDFNRDFDIDVDLNIDPTEIEERMKAFEEQFRGFEEHFRSKEFQMSVGGLTLWRDGKKLELGRQFPVPAVPPMPPRNPGQKPRERERRRIPQGWVESTEPFTRAFPVSRGATLMLSNISGNILVSPGAGERIEVEALKRAWGPNAEQAKARLGDATVETYATANRVEVRVDYGGRRNGRGVEVEFNVKVPPDAAIDLRTVSGDIRVTNVKGEVRVQGVSGNLHLEGTARVARVKTVSGDVTLANAGSDLPVSVSTVNGDLLVQSLAARAVDVNTINGDVRITGWSGDRAHIRTLDGDLELQASLTKGGRYEVESHSGDINLSLSEQPGFELEAHTFNGRIRIDFPIRSEGPVRDTDRGPRSVRGTYGDGSSSLRVQTFSGDLTVTRR